MKLDEAPELRLQHDAMRRELSDLRGRVEAVSRRVPDSPREGEFLSDLSRIGASHGVSIDDFRRGGATDTPTHSVVTVAATARGTYAGLCSLVEEVAGLPRLTEVVSLKATPGRARDDHRFRLTYALYYALDAPAPPDSELP
ncbi:type 4a pilus biogenesis protein PilO [Botrimarina sp.]|uniref:type 4a pilus biogenesis protein PilO n=1 Tax=Botrimarina sp. TaxID=2795802 RepID=UPI0032EE2A01